MALSQESLIYVGDWSSDEDYPYYPVGSKPKRTLICPSEIPHKFLIPGHRYLFKIADGWQRYQAWSEVLAYQVACLIGVSVPPSFIAFDGRRVGSLSEFFYGHPDGRAPYRLVHGAAVLQPTFSHPRRGRPHSALLNAIICRRLLKIPDSNVWWASTLVLDALIGNVDRHPENWGYLLNQKSASERRMAPVYDNGASLGYEISEDLLEAASSPTHIEAYIRKGRHDLSWLPRPDQRMDHFELCRSFAGYATETGETMRNMIQSSLSPFYSTLEHLRGIECRLPLTTRRASFIKALVAARQRMLTQALGQGHD